MRPGRAAGGSLPGVPVRVFHADDDDLFRHLVGAVLPDDEIAIVGSAASPEETVEGVAREQPDVVLLDQIGGAELVERVRAVAPRTRVIVLSGYHRGDGDRELEACCDGYVVKAPDFGELRAVVLGG